MSDLVERLRGPWSVGTRGPITTLMAESADEIARLRAENERLTGENERVEAMLGSAERERVKAFAKLDTATRALSDLRKYARHRDGCPANLSKAGLYGHACTCGFAALSKDERG